MYESILQSVFGGVLIGLAATLMLLLNGRVTGISGILNGILNFTKGDLAWRLAFALGLVVGGVSLYVSNPEYFVIEANASMGVVALAGLLVGFGAVLGSGCTSGHAVCGLSRFSIRSILATIVFMSVGILSATVLRDFIVGG